MIDLRPLKLRIHESDKFRGSDIERILQDYPDSISENEFITLAPILLRLGKIPEIVA